MQKSELATVMSRLSCFYENFTVTDKKVDAWFLIFNSYPAELMQIAVKNYTMNNRYAPTPQKLKLSFQKAWKEYKERLKYEAMQKHAAGEVCKYCEGTGWFYTLYGEGLKNSFVSPCRCQGNSSSLNKALKCKEVEWSDKHRAFIPKK